MNSKLSLKKYNIILALLLVAIEALSVVVSLFVNSTSKETAIDFMRTTANEQSQAITEYVKKQEDRLIDYSKSFDVIDVLRARKKMDSLDKKSEAYADAKTYYETAQKRAQKYFESISRTVDLGGNDEGIYVSTFDTEVIAHTNVGTVGVVTRTNEKLALLQESLRRAGDHSVYNAGIILSPVGDHQQIVSLYKAVYDPDTNEILGLVGMGVYTDKLTGTLGLSISGMEGTEFNLLNVADNKYIFKQNDEIKTSIIREDGTQGYEYKTVSDLSLSAICNTYNSSSYTVLSGESYGDDIVDIYVYNPEYNWVYVIRAKTIELYATAIYVNHFMRTLIVGVLVVGLIAFFINRKMISLASAFDRSIKKNADIGSALKESFERDTLTTCLSRGSFYEHFSKKGNVDEPIYFVQYCFTNMREMNEVASASKTDEYLMKISKSLLETYGNKYVYRISDKEFVCISQGKDRSSVLNDANSSISTLRQPFMVNDQPFQPLVDAAIVQQSKNINISVLTALKSVEVMNKPTPIGNIPLVNRDL